MGASGVPTNFSISNGVFAVPVFKGGSPTTSMKQWRDKGEGPAWSRAFLVFWC